MCIYLRCLGGPRLLTTPHQEDAEKLIFIWDGKKCTFNGETDPWKPGKPIAFKVEVFCAFLAADNRMS